MHRRGLAQAALPWLQRRESRVVPYAEECRQVVKQKHGAVLAHPQLRTLKRRSGGYVLVVWVSLLQFVYSTYYLL